MILKIFNALNYHHCKVFTIENKIFEVIYYIVIIKYSYFIMFMCDLIYLFLTCLQYFVIDFNTLKKLYGVQRRLNNKSRYNVSHYVNESIDSS